MLNLTTDYKITENYCQITLSGNLDNNNSTMFFNEINDIVGFEKVIIFDMKHLDYIDSSGVGIIFEIIKILSGKKLHLYVYNLNEKVANIFRLVGLNQYLKILDPGSIKTLFKS